MTLIAAIAILGAASFCAPYYLSDEGNSFFRNFVNHELLSVLGVVVTITLASAANLHLELNKLQDITNEPFREARKAVRLCSYALITAFFLAVVLVIVKPTIPTTNATGIALVNSGVILLLAASIAVLTDLTGAILDIPPATTLKAGNDDTPGSPRQG